MAIASALSYDHRMPTKPRPEPAHLSPPRQAQLRALRLAHGTATLARLLGCGRDTVDKLHAGLGATAAARDRMEEALERLERAGPEEVERMAKESRAAELARHKGVHLAPGETVEVEAIATRPLPSVRYTDADGNAHATSEPIRFDHLSLVLEGFNPVELRHVVDVDLETRKGSS